MQKELNVVFRCLRFSEGKADLVHGDFTGELNIIDRENGKTFLLMKLHYDNRAFLI